MQEFFEDIDDSSTDFDNRWITSYDEKYTVASEQVLRIFLRVKPRKKYYEICVHCVNTEKESIETLVFFKSFKRLDVINEKIRFRKWLTKDNWLGAKDHFKFESWKPLFKKANVKISDCVS